MQNTVAINRERFQLTARDVAMLHSLSTGRYLTAQALEWLHFPGWEQRSARQQTHESDRSRGKRSSRLYQRLRHLRAHDLIQHVPRQLMLAITRNQQDAHLFALGRRGAEQLALHTGAALDSLWYENLHERSLLPMAHALTIGLFYAALRATLERMPGITLEDWQGDHLLARSYDTVVVGRSRLAVRPDATFVIHHPSGSLRCFLEVDRGRSVTSWR